MIIILSLIVVIIIIAYNSYFNRKIEHFTASEENKIKNLINEIYKADIEAIRNLSNYATYLMEGSNSNVKTPGNLTITGSMKANIIEGDTLKLGNVTINSTQLSKLVSEKFGTLIADSIVVNTKKGIELGPFRIAEFMAGANHGLRFSRTNDGIDKYETPNIFLILSGEGQVTVAGHNNNTVWNKWNNNADRVN
jgi:hypothetical protein